MGYSRTSDGVQQDKSWGTAEQVMGYSRTSDGAQQNKSWGTAGQVMGHSRTSDGVQQDRHPTTACQQPVTIQCCRAMCSTPPHRHPSRFAARGSQCHLHMVRAHSEQAAILQQCEAGGSGWDCSRDTGGKRVAWARAMPSERPGSRMRGGREGTAMGRSSLSHCLHCQSWAVPGS